MQAPTEAFQQRLLAFENAFLCFRYRKPAAPIDFGDLNQMRRPGWPFDLAQIALQVLGIAVSLEGPCSDGLSARLFDHAQVNPRTLFVSDESPRPGPIGGAARSGHPAR